MQRGSLATQFLYYRTHKRILQFDVEMKIICYNEGSNTTDITRNLYLFAYEMEKLFEQILYMYETKTQWDRK